MNRGQMSVTDQVNVQFHVQQQQIDLHLKKIYKVKLLMIMLVKNSHYFFNSRRYLGLVLL